LERKRVVAFWPNSQTVVILMRIALKIVPRTPHLSPEALERIVREALL
jgi:hypothetical protein